MERKRRERKINLFRREMWGPLLMGIMMVGVDCLVNTQISSDDESRISEERAISSSLWATKVSNYGRVWVDDDPLFTLIGLVHQN